MVQTDIFYKDLKEMELEKEMKTVYSITYLF